MRRLVTSMTANVGLAMLLVAGCNGSDAPVASNAAGERSAAGDRFLLAEEPAGAKGVTQVRQDAKDGDAIVVVGRIGGDVKPWVDGRAAFWIVDPSLRACGEGGDEDNCKTPWDYCCTPKEELAKAMATIKFVDEAGHTIATDSREFLGLKELQTVVVRGTAKRDADGNLTVIATGVYRRPEKK